MTPAELAAVVLSAARSALAERGLDVSVLPEMTSLERPRNPEHGDYASTLALQLAKKVGLAPRDLAVALADKLAEAPGIKAVEIAGPGFLNVRLDPAAAGELARVVVLSSRGYGRSRALSGQRLNLEFVSANPTGPLHLGHTRWAAVGDALSRLLRAVDAEVTTEYYFNDAGGQIDRFARSLLASARGEPVPENGYGGEYIHEITARVLADHPDEKTISLLAISVSHLETCWDFQLELPFGLEDEKRRPGTTQGMARWSADRAMDMIRDRFGCKAVGYGSVALGLSRSVPDAFRELAEKDL